MTHRGIKQTVVSALPTLRRLAKAPDKHRRMLGCMSGGHLHAVPDGPSREIVDYDWSVCPLDLLGDPHFGAIFDLDRLAGIAPLSGFPDRFAPWAVMGLMALRQAQGKV